ncbi:competence type IV pilus minor pilin ComGD [Evansella cellulosilytica]|uniref:Prepilin-type N-terminal cleavage/methylation domain-containing protein n=1 Tax=Evansella cellulosilytica (strain ATCC 21833 / DSM 2522 / FERM P-1141 / JCM 9156 / N-4) TaxID=649639 RepID=E6TWZ1_EVAC2|nr:competence type IV pilus minor pilin ComGD [Evansella cellulosilytica]ADU29941.1 hypothetical protein Bcell_1678 [Evansella cellulosilytica DSM 2522]
MRKEWTDCSGGYTLIEILIVLLLITSFLLVSIPHFSNSVRSKDVDYFFELLEKDLYESQLHAMIHGEIVRFIFSPEEEAYFIRSNMTMKVKRPFPKGLSVRRGSLDYTSLRFLPTGTISFSGTILFYYKDDTYMLVFQFVRGRFYIEKW